MAFMGNSGKKFNGIMDSFKGMIGEIMGGDEEEYTPVNRTRPEILTRDSEPAKAEVKTEIFSDRTEPVSGGIYSGKTHPVQELAATVSAEPVVMKAAEPEIITSTSSFTAPVMAAENTNTVSSTISNTETNNSSNSNYVGFGGNGGFIKPADFFKAEPATFVAPVSEPAAKTVNEAESRPAMAESREIRMGGTQAMNSANASSAFDTPKKTVERVGSSGVGFNYSGQSSDISASSAPRTSFSTQKSSSAGSVVQFFEPKDTKQADDICTVLKAGHIVVVNLCHIKDDNEKLRIIDFVAGCCKGIDAKAHTIAPKSIFIAAPKGVELRKPVDYTAEQTTADGAASSGAPFFGGINFGAAAGNERNTNFFTPNF